MGASKSKTVSQNESIYLKPGDKVDVKIYPEGSWLAREIKEIYLKTKDNDLWKTPRGKKCLDRIPRCTNYYFVFDSSVKLFGGWRLSVPCNPKWEEVWVMNKLSPSSTTLRTHLELPFDDRHIITLWDEDSAVMEEARKIASDLSLASL